MVDEEESKKSPAGNAIVASESFMQAVGESTPTNVENTGGLAARSVVLIAGTATARFPSMSENQRVSSAVMCKALASDCVVEASQTPRVVLLMKVTSGDSP
jgi:hypothetical protein